MPVKANWENGEQFNASDANAVGEAVNAAYVKPAGGVPITDMTSGVQVSLGKADTAVQSVTSTSITDSTTTGRAVVTATDAAAARTTLGVAYGSSAGTVVEGNDSRLSPSSTSISDSTATGRSLLTAADPAAARTAIGVAYGSTGGTVAQGNDSRITGAEQTSAKGVANGYASLDGGGKVPVAQLPSSIMQYQGTYNASTNTPSLANGTGDTGDVYRVSVAGSRNFGAGAISFEVGDYAIYNGSTWEKSDTTDAVSTVAGLTGDVTASSLRGAIATGTPSSTTWLRGDGAWETLPASGITRSVQTITTPTTLGSAANTDYVVFSDVSTVAGSDLDVVALLRGNGSNASTTITDSSSLASNWTVVGNAKLDTTTKKLGTASIAFPTDADSVRSSAAISNFQFGTGNFTIEMFFYFNGTPANVGLIDFRGGTSALSPVVFYNGQLYYFDNFGIRISGASVSANTWHHLAVTRSSGSTRMFLNGNQTGSTYSDTGNYSASGWYGVNIGNFNGFVDEVRIIKGRAAYTSNFTPPTAEFPAALAAIPATVTLPTAVGNTNQYTVKNINAETLPILRTSSQTIDGASGGVNLTTNSIARYVSDGTNWRTV